jgi:hypothetical protein
VSQSEQFTRERGIMVSNTGLADRAVAALASGNEKEANGYADELYARLLAYPDSAQKLLIEAGWREALVKCMTYYTFGQAKEINRLHLRLLKLTDADSAGEIMIAGFLATARELKTYPAVQRLVKILCRYVDSRRATDAFRQAGLPIIITRQIKMMQSGNRRERPLILQPRAALLVRR